MFEAIYNWYVNCYFECITRFMSWAMEHPVMSRVWVGTSIAGLSVILFALIYLITTLICQAYKKVVQAKIPE